MNRYLILDMLQGYGSDWDILKVQSFWNIRGGGEWTKIRKQDSFSWTRFNQGKLKINGEYVPEDQNFQRLLKLERFLEVKWIDVLLGGNVELEFNPLTDPCANNWEYILGRAIVSQNIELVWRVLEHRFDKGPLDWNDKGIWQFAKRIACAIGNWDIFCLVAEETDDIGNVRKFFDLKSVAFRGGNKRIMEYLDENRGRLVSAEDI